MAARGGAGGSTVPAKLLLSGRAPSRHVFAGRALTVEAGRRRRADKEEPRRPRTFVDSLPVAMCALEAATKAIRGECDATFGRAHVMDGKDWHTPNPDKPKPAHTEFLARKVPWRFLANDGARDVLDEEHHAHNPNVELGVSGRGNNQIHALVNVFTEAISSWVQAGTRVYMGKRKPDDDTPDGSFAPAAFPTQHAMLLKTKPHEWEVPDHYAGKVCRVIARLEDADEPTRFWVVCPVRSTGLKPWTPEWAAFVSQLCAAAAKSEPVDGLGACLVPVVPGFSTRNPMYGIEGLVHACTPPHAHPDDAVPPAHIMDAFISGYLQLDESGVEPAEESRWDEDEDEDEDEEEDKEDEVDDDDEDDDVDGEADDEDKDKDKDADEDADEPKVAGKATGTVKGKAQARAKATDAEDKEPPPSKSKLPMALAFTPTDDLLVAVCDTRLAFPLMTVVVCNEDLRGLEFHGHRDDDEGGGSGEDDDRGDKDKGRREKFIVDWGLLRDKRSWVAWSPRM